MSAASLERDLAQHLEFAGYSVVLRPSHPSIPDSEFITVVVMFDGKGIGGKNGFTSYRRAARWARRRIKSHQKAVRIIAGVIRP